MGGPPPGWRVFLPGRPRRRASGFPRRYLAGVECDGATYHRSATARDRDRLREMVLNGLGWRIRRIWSTEWWMDAAAATDKIYARLTADLDADRASRAAGQTPEEPTAAVDDVATAPSASPSADPAPARPPTAILTEPPVMPPRTGQRSRADRRAQGLRARTGSHRSQRRCGLALR